MHEHGGFAFGLQAVDHAQRALDLAREHGLAELEDVEAGHIDHGLFDLLDGEGAGRVQQAELDDFLVRGEQVAFDAIGEEGQGALAGLTRLDLLALGGQALGDPQWQLAALDRVAAQGQARAIEGGEPGAVLLRLVQARQGDQREQAVVALGGLAVLLQGLRALLAGLARGDADLDDLLVTEQGHFAGRTQQARPVKVRTTDGVHLAFGEAGCARSGADGVTGLLGQQGLVTVQRVDGLERTGALAQVGRELVEAQLHGRGRTLSALRRWPRAPAPKPSWRPAGRR